MKAWLWRIGWLLFCVACALAVIAVTSGSAPRACDDGSYLGPPPPPPAYHRTTYADSREFTWPVPCQSRPVDSIACVLAPRNPSRQEGE